jgi:hypothetical protein
MSGNDTKTTSDDEVVLVCARIADMPEPPVPSLPRICELCGYRVWMSLRSPTIDRIWCRQCATDKVGSGETVEEIEKGRLS